MIARQPVDLFNEIYNHAVANNTDALRAIVAAGGSLDIKVDGVTPIIKLALQGRLRQVFSLSRSGASLKSVISPLIKAGRHKLVCDILDLYRDGYRTYARYMHQTSMGGVYLVPHQGEQFQHSVELYIQLSCEAIQVAAQAGLHDFAMMHWKINRDLPEMDELHTKSLDALVAGYRGSDAFSTPLNKLRTLGEIGNKEFRRMLLREFGSFSLEDRVGFEILSRRIKNVMSRHNLSFEQARIWVDPGFKILVLQTQIGPNILHGIAQSRFGVTLSDFAFSEMLEKMRLHFQLKAPLLDRMFHIFAEFQDRDVTLIEGFVRSVSSASTYSALLQAFQRYASLVNRFQLDEYGKKVEKAYVEERGVSEAAGVDLSLTTNYGYAGFFQSEKSMRLGLVISADKRFSIQNDTYLADELNRPSPKRKS